MVINRFADGGKFLLINTLIWDEIRIPIKTPTVLYEINIWIELNKSFAMNIKCCCRIIQLSVLDGILYMSFPFYLDQLFYSHLGEVSNRKIWSVDASLVEKDRKNWEQC